MAFHRLKRLALVLLVSACVGLIAGPLHAHHSHSMFDADDELTLKGQVVGLRYANPHIRMLVQVENANGEVERWDVEMSTIVNMRSRGVTREVIAEGNEIELTINPLRDGGHGGNLVRLHAVNGVSNAAEGGNWSPES
jgi:hypothetical protein